MAWFRIIYSLLTKGNVMPKKTTKKTAKKVTKKVAKKATSCKKTALKLEKPLNKSQLATTIAEMSCLSKKDVNCVFDSLYDVIATHLKKRGGVGEFTLPGIAKLKVVNKPATKARKGTNPFTGEEMMFKAKPARNIVKIRPLKKIKDATK